MELAHLIQPGQVEEVTFTVENSHAAPHIGSGSLRVLATPWMIGKMEGCAHTLLTHSLPDGYSSVGIVVNVRHLAATPIGAQVRVRTEVTAVEKNTVTFRVQAWDAVDLIGEGEHQRAVVEEARFLKRVQAKEESVK